MLFEYREWIRMAYEQASHSPDTSTQVGAFLINPLLNSPIIVETMSYNSPPIGWKLTLEDLERPRKYSIFEHAERRAIYKAARNWYPTERCIMVGNWAACADCSRAIVEAGIMRLIRHKALGVAATPGWEESVSLGDEILKAGGVEIIEISGPIAHAPKVLRGGEIFDPSL